MRIKTFCDRKEFIEIYCSQFARGNLYIDFHNRMYFYSTNADRKDSYAQFETNDLYECICQIKIPVLNFIQHLTMKYHFQIYTLSNDSIGLYFVSEVEK